MNEFIDPKNHHSEIRCPSCRALYRVPTDTLRNRSRLRCSSCTHIFQSPFYTASSSPPPAEDPATPPEKASPDEASQTPPPPNLFISPEKEQEYLNAITFDSKDDFNTSATIPEQQRHRLFTPTVPTTPDIAEKNIADADAQKPTPIEKDPLLPLSATSKETLSKEDALLAPKSPLFTAPQETTTPPPVKTGEDSQLEKLSQWTTSQADRVLKTSSHKPYPYTPGYISDSEADSSHIATPPPSKMARLGLTLIFLIIAVAVVTGGWLSWSFRQQQFSQKKAVATESLFTVEHWPRGDIFINEQKSQLLVVNGNLLHQKIISEPLNLVRVVAVVQTGSPVQPQRQVAYGWGGVVLSLEQLKKWSASKSLNWGYTDEARQQASEALPLKKTIPFQLIFQAPSQPVTFLDAEVIEYTLGSQRIKLESQHITSREQLIQNIRQLHYRITNPIFRTIRNLQER